MKIQSWCKMFWVNKVKNGCDHSGHKSINLTIFGKWIDERNWFFACFYKFRKVRNYFNNFWLRVVKNGCGHLGYETLKLALFQKGINKINWFFACR